jgi:hypothetical protein
LCRPTSRVAAARREVVETAAARTPTGDDILDWGDDEAEVEVQEVEAIQKERVEIRRPHSTPPTPWTGFSSIDVPVRALVYLIVGRVLIVAHRLCPSFPPNRLDSGLLFLIFIENSLFLVDIRPIQQRFAILPWEIL